MKDETNAYVQIGLNLLMGTIIALCGTLLFRDFLHATWATIIAVIWSLLPALAVGHSAYVIHRCWRVFRDRRPAELVLILVAPAINIAGMLLIYIYVVRILLIARQISSLI